MEISTSNLNDSRVLKSFDNLWFVRALSLFVETSAPSIDKAIFTECEGVIVAACYLLDSCLEASDPRELPEAWCA